MSRFDLAGRTAIITGRATILWTSLAARAWMARHGGVVVNAASIGGMAFEADLGLYNASKAALIHLTEQLALELSPEVRINAVAPGGVRTILAEAFPERSHRL